MEGSVFAIALCLAAGVVFLVQAHRANHLCTAITGQTFC